MLLCSGDAAGERGCGGCEEVGRTPDRTQQPGNFTRRKVFMEVRLDVYTFRLPRATERHQQRVSSRSQRQKDHRVPTLAHAGATVTSHCLNLNSFLALTVLVVLVPRRAATRRRDAISSHLQPQYDSREFGFHFDVMFVVMLFLNRV